MTNNTDSTTANGTETTTDDPSKPDWWDDLDDGERADAVVDDQHTERKYIRHEGKRYWFDFRDISWNKKSEFLDDALVIERNSRELNTTKYYRSALDYAVVDASIPIENWATFMTGVKSQLGEKLTAEIPAPGRNLDEDEEGNSDEQSGAEETGADHQTPPETDTTDGSSN